MKTPGPPPTPTNLKLLRGNPGKRKLNTNEPDPAPAIPPCPGHLDKVAKKEWRRISKELLALGNNLEAGSRRSRRLLRRVRALGGGGTADPENTVWSSNRRAATRCHRRIWRFYIRHSTKCARSSQSSD